MAKFNDGLPTKKEMGKKMEEFFDSIDDDLIVDRSSSPDKVYLYSSEVQETSCIKKDNGYGYKIPLCY